MNATLDVSTRARLEAILRPGHTLREGDVDLLIAHLPLSPSRTQRQLEERDVAIRDARRFAPMPETTVAAKALARALDLYLRTQWPDDRLAEDLPPEASEQRRALHRIARLNDGRPMRWGQVYNILRGARFR